MVCEWKAKSTLILHNDDERGPTLMFVSCGCSFSSFSYGSDLDPDKFWWILFAFSNQENSVGLQSLFGLFKPHGGLGHVHKLMASTRPASLIKMGF